MIRETQHPLRGNAPLMFADRCFEGVHVACVSVTDPYEAPLRIEAKQRPDYVVREDIGE